MAEYWEAFVAWIKALWTDFVEFLTELPLLVLDAILSALAAAITAIPVPDFVDDGLGAMLNDVDPSIIYFLAKSGLPEGFAILGAGVAFHLLRNVVTLFQW